MAFIDDIKRTYSQGSMLMRLILINIGVFILIRLLAFGAVLFSGSSFPVLQWVELPGDWWLALRRPWTLVTYMFVHNDLWHILFNMLWLYWLGRIFMEFFSSKQLSGLYILGGLGGGALYLLCSNLLGHLHGSALIGSSAAVIAIVVAAAVYVPDYKIGLLFLGQVAIKWVALVTVLIAVLSLDGGNIGGNIAHLGGAAVGAWYALRIKRGRDITRPLNAMIDAVVGLFNGRSVKKVASQWRQSAADRSRQQDAAQRQPRGARPADTVSEEELDNILRKIKVAGYDALTDAEKDKLFKASRRREP